MLKKLSALVLALSLIASLCACTGTAPSSSSEDSVPSSSASSEPDAASANDDNTLTVFGWDPAFTGVSLEEAEKVYQKINPDFKLNFVETSWNDVQTLIITAASSQDYSILPDVLICQNNAFQKNLMNYGDLFLDLSDCGVKYEDFSAASTAYSTLDGKHYGIPFDNGASVFALRTDILEQAGLTMADFTDITWDECIEKGKLVKEKTGLPLFSFSAGGADMVLMMLQSAGSSLFDENGLPDMVGNEALKTAMETYKALIDAGVMIEVNGWDEYVASFINGSVAGTLNGCWILSSVQLADDQKGNWNITNIPRLEGVEGATNYTANGGSSWAVMTSSDKKELGADFLKNTFGGSKELSENILLKAGCLSNWKPAAESDVYAKPLEFFGNQAVYADIVDYASKVPTNYTGVYYYEAADALAVAMTNVINGQSDIETALQSIQDEVEFNMQ